MTAPSAGAAAAVSAAHRRKGGSWRTAATWVVGSGAMVAVPLALWLAPVEMPQTLGYLAVGVPVIAVVSFLAVDIASRRAAKHRRLRPVRPGGVTR